MNGRISKEMKRYNYLSGEMEAVYHEMSLRLGLSDSAMRILYTICNEGDSCPLPQIRCLSGLSKQTLNSAIRKLENQGILYLEQVNAKSKKACLTETGKELAGRTALQILLAEDAILASWPQQDVEKYLELTDRFLAALKEKSAHLGKNVQEVM
ncbi:MAG: winged helix-turn-helix transcriptional regulator [Lachnospiraceae bacterium]|nr:winged helix-turn-helix transcriptional regulator [Lachnospiraceae bacterium]